MIFSFWREYPRTRGFAAYGPVCVSQNRGRRPGFRRLSLRANFGVSFSRAHRVNQQRRAGNDARRAGEDAAIVVVKSRPRSARLTRKPECGALVRPNTRNTLQQPLDGQGSGLATFDDRLDNVGRQVAEPQDSADIGVAQSVASCDLHRGRIYSASKGSHPDLGTGDGENEGVVESPRRGISPARNNDLLSGTRPRSRQRRYMELRNA